MLKHVTISYLTGDQEIMKNALMGDYGMPRERRTLGQMFFQPYEDKKEFIFCARHTLITLPILMICKILNFSSLKDWSVIIRNLSVACVVAGGMSKLCGDKNKASFFLDVTFAVLAQLLVDLIVFPLSALIMLTRGTSTGLHAAAIGRSA